MSKPTTHVRIVRDLSEAGAKLVAPRNLLSIDLSIIASLEDGSPWEGRARITLDAKKGVAQLDSAELDEDGELVLGPTDEDGAGIWHDLFEHLAGGES